MEAAGPGPYDAHMSPEESEARVVLSTAPDETRARALARELVDRGLAACVNILPGATSIYRWQGAVEEAREVLLVIKTVAARQAELERVWLELHPYDVPEFVVLAPQSVEPRYLAWLRQETAPRP